MVEERVNELLRPGFYYRETDLKHPCCDDTQIHRLLNRAGLAPCNTGIQNLTARDRVELGQGAGVGRCPGPEGACFELRLAQ